MIEHMYTGQYTSAPTGHGPDNRPARSFHAMAVFKLADKYCAQSLAWAARTDFCKAVILGEWTCNGFSDVVRELYNTCPDGIHAVKMRDVAVAMAVRNEKELMAGPLQIQIRAAIEEVTLFGLEFKKQSLSQAIGAYEYQIRRATSVFKTATEELLIERQDKLAAMTKCQMERMEELRKEHKQKLKAIDAGKRSYRCRVSTCRFNFLEARESGAPKCPFCGSGGATVIQLNG